MADAVREIVELALAYGLEMPCVLPALPGNRYDLCIATVALDYCPKDAREAVLVKLLRELVYQWGIILSHPALDEGAVAVHCQSLRGIARNAAQQRFEETGAGGAADTLALELYPRHSYTA